MRLIEGSSCALFVFIFVVSARPNAPSTSQGVEENGAKTESSISTTNRVEPEPEISMTTENLSKGQEVQSIQVESSVMSSKAESSEPVLPSSTESNDIGRAVMSTSPTPIGESLKTVTKQLLQSPTATDMVITDIRTPPKIQQQIELISPGKGEAVPVLMEEDAANSFEKLNEQNTRQPSTPSSGLSTWILLNGDFSSTPYSYSKKPLKQNERYSSTASSVFETSSKRPMKPIIDMVKITSTTERTKQKDSMKKGPRPNLGVVKPVSNPKKPLNATVKPTVSSTTPPAIITESEVGKPLVTLQDSKFKNKTPIIVGRIPLPSKDKEKPEIVAASSSMRPIVSTQSPTIETLNFVTNMTRFGTPVVTFPHVPPRIKPVSNINISKEQLSPNTMYNSPSTLRPFVTSTLSNRNNASNEVVQETTTQPIVTTTQKKIKTSQKKKKKKNKNRRKTPSKKTSSVAESKITPVDINATSKVPGSSTSRPLSTRIYNYLAREVMPNVGIGVVGLMLTAGLAGLFLYPFGGGIAARRTSYERPVISKYGPGPGPGPHRPHHYYNPQYNHGAVGMDNGQPEEAVLGQVLTGMDYSPYSRERPSSGAPSSPIYDPNDSYNSPDVVGYAGESINPNTKYSTINTIQSNANNVKYTKIQQDQLEQKHPTYTGDTQTESSSALVNSPDNNQLSPESKFSNINIGSDANLEETYLENNSPVDRNKNYKSDLTGNDFEKYTVHNSNYPTDTRVNTQDNANHYTSENSVYNANENYNNDFISYSASVGSVYNEDAGYSSSDVKNHRPDTNAHQEYQEAKVSANVKKDSENDTNIIDQPSYSALEGIPNYNMEGSDDLYKDSSNYNMFNYRNDHGIIIEHGPRKLKIQKRSTKNEDLKNDIDEINNEIDSVLPNEDKFPLDNFINSVELSTPDNKLGSNEVLEGTTSTTTVTTDTSISTTMKSEETTLSNTNNSNDVENIKGTQFNISDFKKPQQQNEEFSLISVIRRITQFKLQLGLRLLQSTSQAFSRYMGSLQQRMENVVRAINDQYRARNKDSNIPPKIVVPNKQIIENDNTTDNFVQIHNVKVKDVEKINVNSQNQEEMSTVKVETFTKEASTSNKEFSSPSNGEVSSTTSISTNTT
ncbi:uncharacterized protein LOC103512946 [Diaphorina citri]|uniref:Uncharacterized protein LOC103512946 n=1 Tax=Diaphorina citri TaxID=121845 RepID=A0A1S3D791_DIACI|nr:uncharacterized protein LOC103512946 [Diaphorina citri]